MKKGWEGTIGVVLLAMAMIICSAWTGSAQNVEHGPDAVPVEAPDETSVEASFEEVRKEMRELGQALGRYGVEQRDRALERSKPALEDLDRRLDALEKSIENNWDEMSQAARERSRRAMRELRRQRVELAERYGALKSSSAGAWEQMREGFLDAFSVLNEAWEKSIEEFREQRDAKDEVKL
ncbi:hypothetical protein SAMN06295888_11327 [Desulfonatronum zhilinae]|nr:hypothetical protein SAMN06295888_11327 [Desulfonatronum zhilinae]